MFTLLASSLTLSVSQNDGILNIVIGLTDGSSRILAFTDTGIKYYIKPSGGVATQVWSK